MQQGGADIPIHSNNALWNVSDLSRSAVEEFSKLEA